MSMKQGLVRSTSLALFVVFLLLAAAPALAAPAEGAPAQPTLVAAILDWLASLAAGSSEASAGIDPDGAPVVSSR